MHFVLRWADYEHDGLKEGWKNVRFLFGKQCKVAK
jgi:hypothetical protein